MTDDQLVALWQLYQDQLKSDGPDRDGLPYTNHFEEIWSRINDKFGTEYSRNEVWRALGTLDKSPAKRKALGIVD